MRILSVSLTNFASYKSLDFDFENQGLTLIQGPTGSGKSTLCDAIPWVLFGKTAKGGAVDDILSWDAGKGAYGLVIINNGAYDLQVVRTRKPNDLYFSSPTQTEIRGKDLADTQRLLNQALGITYEAYLAGAYFHEFSATAGFFTAPAKARRALVEQLVDMSLATQVQAGISPRIKDARLSLVGIKAQAVGVAKAIEYIQAQIIRTKQQARTWELAQSSKIVQAIEDRASFQQRKDEQLEAAATKLASLPEPHHERLKELQAEVTLYTDMLQRLSTETCNECGANLQHLDKEVLVEAIHANKTEQATIKRDAERYETATFELSRIMSEEDDSDRRIRELGDEKNPYDETVPDDVEALFLEQSATQDMRLAVSQELADLQALEDIVADYRTTTVKNTVDMLQHATNMLLSKHFDAEIQVRFEPGADNLDTTILKDGNECTFTQLSKGQRQLLKLCFGISVMETVSNHLGVHHSVLFLDEAFDGLDETLKVKAFGLLTAVAANHESVFVVEHSAELKSRFLNKFTVSLANGASTIEKAD